MSILRRLHSCQLGAAIIEFAMVAPAFLLLLFGVIEGSRLVWTRQTLAEVAYSTARCMAVSIECGTAVEQRGYAAARAGGYGLVVPAANVTPESSVNCNGFPNSTRVTLVHHFDSILDGFVPNFSGDVRVGSCFPVLT